MLLQVFSLPLKNPVLIFSLILFIILLTPVLLQRLRIPDLIGLIIAGAVIFANGIFDLIYYFRVWVDFYSRGSLFEGIMAAYRNPAAHANLQYEKREAMEQIMLASQLMYVLDKPQL